MSGVKGTFFLVVSGVFACLPAVVLSACNLFKGFDSFRSGTKAPQATPAPTQGLEPSGEKDAGVRSRTGSVDVRARLPEGALTPTPIPQEK
jgi:hypothetical protein